VIPHESAIVFDGPRDPRRLCRWPGFGAGHPGAHGPQLDPSRKMGLAKMVISWDILMSFFMGYTTNYNQWLDCIPSPWGTGIINEF